MNRRQALSRGAAAAVATTLSGAAPRMLYADNHDGQINYQEIIDYALTPNRWIGMVQDHRELAITFNMLRVAHPITGNEHENDYRGMVKQLIKDAFSDNAIAVLEAPLPKGERDRVREGLAERAGANSTRLDSWFAEIGITGSLRITLLRSQAVFAALTFVGLYEANPAAADWTTWVFPFCFWRW